MLKRGYGSLLFVLYLAFTLSAWAQALPRQSSWGDELSGPVKSWLQDALVPGISIAIIEEGRISWQGAFGTKNAETGEPVTEATVFEAASMSKPVFAYAVLKLVDKGALDLDKPLADYLAGADMKTIYPPVASASDDRWKKITARMVLTHRTGFPNWFSGSTMRFVYDPGQRFSYSGEGFSLLGAAVSVITGRSLNALLQETVFDPLQMNASSYVWRPDYDTSFTAGHDMLGQRTQRGKRTQFMPGASLYTTAGDYARFLLALGSGDGLTEKTWREMTSAQVEVMARDDKPCFSWGLGVGVHQPEKDTKTLWHWGDNGDLKCYFEIIPKQKRGVVFLMNGANGHAISPLFTRRILGIAMPAIATRYFDYDTLNSTPLTILRTYRIQGISAAIQVAAASSGDLGAEDSPEIQRLMSLVEIMLRNGDISGAKTAVEFVLQHQRGSLQAQIARGGIYLLEGDEAEMERWFQHAHQSALSTKNPANAARGVESWINGLGYLLLGQNKHEMAIKVLKFNVSAFPKSANVYDSLGEAYLKSGNKQQAIENYTKALEIDPSFPTAINALRELQK
jgi:CubicO group peptidase (beta-lactamase class C family)/Tfp pilus assembly protein PilF